MSQEPERSHRVSRKFQPGEDEQYDTAGAEAICPHCGHGHGDCWELCPDEDHVEVACDNCERTFEAWSVQHVTVHTQKVKP